MSKGARDRSGEKRKQQKRARRQAQQDQYRKWADDGTNKKSKRSVLKTQRRSGVRTVRHAITHCGNVGCKRCFPALNAA